MPVPAVRLVPADAEDQLQETLIRAWRSYGDFEGRSSLRTWLYRIATNACLRALENRSRRALPSGPHRTRRRRAHSMRTNYGNELDKTQKASAHRTAPTMAAI